jgi:hypothetical protein
MMRKIIRDWSPIVATILTLFAAPIANAQPTSAAGAPDVASLADRINLLEGRLRAVETEVGELRREKQGMQAQLDRQNHQVADGIAVVSRTARRPAEAQAETEESAPPSESASAWGTRLGYQGFPYGQKEGGFFYSVFFDRVLFREGEEVPFGDLAAEIAVGVGRSGTDHLESTSDALLEKVKIEYRQTMLSGLPSLKYSLNQWSSYGVRPYLVGGPGIWGDIIESPPLFIGQNPASPQLAARKLPVDAGASIYEGGQGGAGIDFSFARTHVPILERLRLGFDYRYSAWTSGQRFSSYGLSLAVSE